MPGRPHIGSSLSCLLVLLLLALTCASAARPASRGQLRNEVGKIKPPGGLDRDAVTDEEQEELTKHHKKHKKHKHAFSSPVGMFIQERASKQLPGPGQHFEFGALVSWDSIKEAVMSNPDAKLLLIVRHGQALSNWLQDALGPDVWFQVETKCTYDDKNGTIYNVFDAELTDLGREQGEYLNTILDGGGWFARMAGNQSARAVVSPLSRCLQTSLLVSKNLPIKEFMVEERVRETLGEDTCDARRSASDPDSSHPYTGGPCSFEDGLRTKFPQFQFPVVGRGAGLGLISDEDTLWTKSRETQKEQVKRATNFLFDLWNFVEEKVVVIYTHSGFTRSILLAVGREPYRPQNTELVPAVVIKKRPPPQPQPQPQPVAVGMQRPLPQPGDNAVGINQPSLLNDQQPKADKSRGFNNDAVRRWEEREPSVLRTEEELADTPFPTIEDF